jgi:RimJ/RimL family protein N-acetyltransferase
MKPNVSSSAIESTVFLRDVVGDDLSSFFEQQTDMDANYMAAFTVKDPTNRVAFLAHWERIRAAATVIVKTIVIDGQVAGYVMSYKEEGRCEVTYWLGKEYWGKGIATQALAKFLAEVNRSRPIYARAAKDNTGSLRILEKCGFAVINESKGFANARDEEIEEFLLELR